jgi:hypothetical protein
MDYESISFLNCSFYIDDGVEESGPFILELTVVNDNEVPVFSDTMYFVTTSEGAVRTCTFFINMNLNIFVVDSCTGNHWNISLPKKLSLRSLVINVGHFTMHSL